MAEGRTEIEALELASGEGRVVLETGVIAPSGSDIRLAIDRMAVGPWLRWLSPGRNFEGVLSGELELKGTRQEPSGFARLRLSSGTLQEFAFRDIEVDIAQHVKIAEPLVEAVDGDNRVRCHGHPTQLRWCAFSRRSTNSE